MAADGRAGRRCALRGRGMKAAPAGAALAAARPAA